MERARVTPTTGEEHRQQAIPAADRAAIKRLRRRMGQFIDAGNVQEALACQVQVTALAPDDPAEFMQLGFLHRQAAQIDSAAAAFEHARRLAPAEPDPHEALAELYLDAARYDDAVRECKALLKLLPNSLPARQILSTAYFNQGRTDKALDITREMVRLAPLDPINHYKNGVLLHQHGHWRAALDEFSSVLRMAPEDSIEYAEATAAVEALDLQQIGIVLSIASDDRIFEMRLARDAAVATVERGFYVSQYAILYLQQVASERCSDAAFGGQVPGRPATYN